MHVFRSTWGLTDPHPYYNISSRLTDLKKVDGSNSEFRVDATAMMFAAVRAEKRKKDGRWAIASVVHGILPVGRSTAIGSDLQH